MVVLLLAVAFGGGLGAMSRYGVGLLYVTASVVLSVMAVLVGTRLGRLV